MMKTHVCILLIALHQAMSDLRSNRSFWSDGNWLPSTNTYEEVPLVQPKFKSKRLALQDWYKESSVERGMPQDRHLEWLQGSEEDTQSADATEPELRKKHHRKKYVKVNKMLLPLLLAYKLKFFTMIPVLIGALTLLVGTTGLAGFFFALFAAAAGLHAKGGHPH